MSFLKRIFGFSDNNLTNTESDSNSIRISKIYKNPTGTVEIDFKVPSKKLFCLSIETDDFSKEKVIQFRQISSYISDKLITWADGTDFIQLSIGLRNKNGQDQIIFSTHQKSLKFKKDDKIAFLFQDQEIKEFNLLENGYRIDKDNEGIIIESFSFINLNDMEKFRNIKTNKWKYIPCDNRKPIIGTLHLELQNDIIEMAKVYNYIFENPIE